MSSSLLLFNQRKREEWMGGFLHFKVTSKLMIRWRINSPDWGELSSVWLSNNAPWQKCPLWCHQGQWCLYRDLCQLYYSFNVLVQEQKVQYRCLAWWCHRTHVEQFPYGNVPEGFVCHSQKSQWRLARKKSRPSPRTASHLAKPRSRSVHRPRWRPRG